MKKLILVLYLILCFSIFSQSKDLFINSIETTFQNSRNYNLSFRNSNNNKVFINHNSTEFFNDNLKFSNRKNSILSILKITGETSIGSLTGFGSAILLKNLFEPDKSIGENWLGIFWQAAMIGVGAVVGTNVGTYTFGKLISDEGSLKNTFYWSLITSGIFSIVGSILTDNREDRFWIAVAGLPIGATIGFNSNKIINFW